MCGIAGYKGHRKASHVLLESLRKLEYRGYDSVGMAVKSSRGIEVRKDVGKVEEVDKKQNFEQMGGNIGIAHTRWSTHGAVTKENSHPHISIDGKIAVVHNGIIENYVELKKSLIRQGIKFKSQTDTEVIPHLIYLSMKQGLSFTEATKRTMEQIEGSFAIVAIHSDSDTMIGARRGSPLVVGIGKNEFFIASDVPAFLEYTNKAIYLNDDELVNIDGKITFIDLKSGREIKKQETKIGWSMEQAKKGKYPHFMLKEINEQKQTINLAASQPAGVMNKVTEMIRGAKGVFFVGCGTSYHACVSAAYVFAHIPKIHVNVVLASEFRNYEEFLTKNTLVVALSQSGETADLLDAIKTAKARGCSTISVTNVMGSTLTRICDVNIMMNAGPEICVLSTKSYTSQLTILMLLAYAVAGKGNEGKALIKKVCDNIDEVIDVNLEKLKALAEKIKTCHDFFLIGRDLAYPTALEGALKIKEVSYMHAEGFAGAELKHGTIALIEPGVPVIVLSTDSTRSLILSNAMEIKSRGGYIIGIDSENNEMFDYYINVPELGSANPILMIIPIQIFAYYLALARGCDPDYPRSLAKCVTVR